MKKILEAKIGTALSELQHTGFLADFVLPEIRVERPKDDQFGEYTTNIALVLSKLAKKSPMEIAPMLQERLSSEEFEKVEVVHPGHINFYFSPAYFRDIVTQINEKKSGISYSVKEKKEKVMVEYSQPNTHKEFHIGHLRNVFIGSTIVNVLRKSGHEVIAANYIGDTGTHIAKCLWGLTKFYADENLDVLSNKAEFLGKVYSEATQKIEDNPEYEDEFKALQKKFEEGDETLVALWKKTKEWSMDEFESIYQQLGVVFDVYFFESIEEEAGKKILPELLAKGILEQSDGAVIANLEQFHLGVLVLVRKDGSALYALKDIPLAKEKFEKYGIDKSVIVVDVRQSLYFQQLFKILELYGFHKKMVHCGYEFVALKGGESMSSRKGNVVPARVLIERVTESVRKQFSESPDPEMVALGAIRFGMLRHSSVSKIEFDVEESVRFDGATGPYVQYAHARIVSILKKAEEKGFVVSEEETLSSLPLQPKEIELIRELSRFSEVVEEVAETYEVHKIAHYAIRLADTFHSFYNDCKVIDEENRAQSLARLELVRATKIVLKETLDLMGIDAPEKM
ncbi:MAG: arginine--tRNA ligase [Candidatus Moranbacteria bacterium]|nr:arginine--tRNA ligase [Candidatus Moranbacteria bacterium]MDD3964514.1 arginine--tRNA ligase [Candidatus Moranbacteria bacterium]